MDNWVKSLERTNVDKKINDMLWIEEGKDYRAEFIHCLKD